LTVHLDRPAFFLSTTTGCFNILIAIIAADYKAFVILLRFASTMNYQL